MKEQRERRLQDRIVEEMAVDRTDALEKSFDLAKQFVRIGRDGRVDVVVRDKVSGKEQILLYLIGKLYAKAAGFTARDDVGNQELMEELGLPKGSLLPWLKELRDKNEIIRITRGRYAYHAIPVSLVEEILTRIDRKLT